MNSNISLRTHQRKAITSIKEAFLSDKKCLVKMFCGTGKTRIAFYLMTLEKTLGNDLKVIVFPSISLITQFNTDYIYRREWKNIIKQFKFLSICSKNELKENPNNIEYSTDKDQILKFLKIKSKKIICVTYQSLETFVSCIEKSKKNIGLLIYDEAHHIIGNKIQKIVFENENFNKKCEKVLFLTATPKNEKGVTMFKKEIDIIDYEDIDKSSANNNINFYESDCGILAYEYTHYQAVQDGICNDFDIAIDFYTDTSYKYKSTFSAIARCIFSTNNTKCLTFHYRSETEHDTKTDVLDFICKDSKEKFTKEYNKVLEREFPKKLAKFKDKLLINGLTCKTKNKKKILDIFDVDDKHVHILASCNTIGEGVDTKNANIVCFVDPRNSFSTIIQNIGRVCRKQNKNSTILLPCYVDAEKYKNCKTPEERDKVIREDMQDNGNFTSILNVLSALKHDDPQLYDLCLKYPKKFAPKEIKENLEKHGYNIGKDVGDLKDVINNLTNNKFSKNITSEDLNAIGKKIKKRIEVHSCDMDEPIKIFNDNKDLDTIRLYENDGKYRPVNPTKDSKTNIKKPKRKPLNIKCHNSNKVEILWNLKRDFDIDTKICQVYIESFIKNDKWFADLDGLKKFMDDNKKRPSSDKNKSKDEKYKASFLIRTRAYYKNKTVNMKDPKKREAWEEFVKKYGKYFERLDWFGNLETCGIMMGQKNKRLYSNSENLEEKYYGKWIEHQQDNYKNNKNSMRDPKKREVWEKFMKKHRKYYEVVDAWYKSLEDLCDAIDETKKKPTNSSKDERIKVCGNFYGHCKANYEAEKGFYNDLEKRKAWENFLKKYKEYLEKPDPWYEKFSILVKFIDEHKRRPSKTRGEEEKKIESWISNQQINYKKNEGSMKDPKKRKVLEDIVKNPKYATYFVDFNNYLESL